eukprot:g225.t1
MYEVKMQQELDEESVEKKKHKRRLMSKYDSVKVYVWIAGDSPHSYVLSRYLIARMLTVAKIPYAKSAKLALKLKKQLVDQEQLNISQTELENSLFEQMQMKGFGIDYFQRLKLVNRFVCEKIPLIISICGAPFTGKSVLAQQLAAKCNLSNVLQTDLIYEMLKKRKDSPLPTQSFVSRTDLDGRDLLVEYDRECLIVKRSLEAEIQKTVQEGKSLIMEGIHLDPGLYISELSQMKQSQDCRTGPNIVYIPVVVTADYEDHRILVMGAANSLGCRFFEAQTNPAIGEEIFGRMRQFQQHLAEYQNKNIVQVEIGLSGIDNALEMLHDHFLQCIKSSLESFYNA